jgi:ketosteroid isomerase-like protein
MKTTAVVVTAFAFLLGAGCSTETRPHADDLAAITAFNERYLGAINDEDIAALSALTTDGHVMLPPNQEPVVGKAANDAMNGGAFENYEFSETWRPVETVIDGDLAFQRGTFTTIATPKEGGRDRLDRLEVNGSFLRIYQRQANGEWRMTRDMFNSSTPLTASLSTGQ